MTPVERKRLLYSLAKGGKIKTKNKNRVQMVFQFLDPCRPSETQKPSLPDFDYILAPFLYFSGRTLRIEKVPYILESAPPAFSDAYSPLPSGQRR